MGQVQANKLSGTKLLLSALRCAAWEEATIHSGTGCRQRHRRYKHGGGRTSAVQRPWGEGEVKFAGQTVPAMWTRAKVGATVSAHWARSPVDSPSASSHGRQRPAQEIIQHLSSGPPAGKGQTNFCGRLGGKNCTGPKMCSPAH